MVSEEFVLKNKAGLNIIGKIDKPRAGGKYPCLIICHGLTRNMNEAVFRDLAKYLSNKGFIVARFDFTNALGRSDGSFTQVSIDGWLLDLKAVFNFVKKLKFVDKNRIGVLGHSISGMICARFMCEVGGARFLILLSSVENYNPGYVIKNYPNINGFHPNRLIEIKDGVFVRVGFYFEARELYTSKFLLKVRDTVLVLHGKKDLVVEPKVARVLYSGIRSRRKEIRFINRADHVYRNKNSRGELNKKVYLWLRKNKIL